MEKVLVDLKKGPKHWYNEVVKAKITPRDIALGFSVGLFIGMLALPILNFILLVLALAILRVNKLAVMFGYVLVLWPTSPFIYYTSLRIGVFIFGGGNFDGINSVTFDLIRQYGIKFALGNLIFAAAASITSFLLIYLGAKLAEKIKKKNLPPSDGLT